jgi:hypothetical protein
METTGDNGRCEEWSLYDDPTILRVSVSALSTSAFDEGWISLTLETHPDNAQCIGVAGKPLNIQDFAADGSTDLASLTLELKLEEIPRLVAVLNEVYRKRHATAVTSLESGLDYGPRWARLPSGQTIRWPIGSRLEPERDPEDLKDRRAILEAYKVVADGLADDLDKLGLLRPIG